MKNQIASNNRIYISGYWKIKSNKKKSEGVYLYGIKKTLKLLKHSAINNIKLTVINRELRTLPAKKYIKGLIEAADSSLFNKNIELDLFDYSKSQEKGAIHYYRDLKLAGVENYQNLLLVWLSKIFLVDEIITERYSKETNDSIISWVDCTIEWVSHTRSNWNFTKQNLPINKFCHYSGSLHYMGVRLPISAAFMSGNLSVWKEIKKKYIHELEEAVLGAYPHDEETILTNIIYKKPELFYSIGTSRLVSYVEYFNKHMSFILKRYTYYRNRVNDFIDN